MKTKTVKSQVRIDLRDQVCPYTFIRTKLKLEEMSPGQILEVTLRGVAIENVPRSIKEEGHTIVHVEKHDGDFTFFIEKSG